jgi:hypothetical protein
MAKAAPVFRRSLGCVVEWRCRETNPPANNPIAEAQARPRLYE